jgi:hypothetical protein
MSMIESPFIECPERTEFSDENYGVIGRALFVAQHYEALLRSLATLLTARHAHKSGEVPSFDDPLFDKFVLELWDRQLGTNIKILDMYGLPKKGVRILHKARAARNYIAHNLTIGIEHEVEKDAVRTQLIEKVAKLVRSIAEADAGVGILIQKITHEPLPNALFVKNYTDKIIQWVCEAGV